MIDLDAAQTPNGHKVSIALEELDLECQVHWVRLDEEEQMKPAFLALNPNHKVPVVVRGMAVPGRDSLDGEPRAAAPSPTPVF